MALDIDLPHASDTENLGARLASQLESGDVIYLKGDLGAGKTTLARGLLAALGHVGRVKSPTYAWVEPYNLSKLSLYHFDFYRFESGTDWRTAGFDEMFDGSAVCVVEWPEKVGSKLPAPDLSIRLRYAPASGRVAEIRARSERGERLMKGLV